ncbi:MAG TPA: hypothetical protein VF665_24650 [Longimicrobium sp.]|jgi:hypothetical protein|uniref:hypothetical protein n=1 Tax=Longimicrobium sp. TaxID=2029185 RepID=UPI002ED90C9D
MIFRRSPFSAAAACALLCAAPACSPVVTHGPRVDPGLTAYATGGGTLALCDSTVCATELIPQLGAGLRYGRPADERRMGWSLGVTASLSVVSSDMDLYAQLPRRPGGVDAGAGVLLGGAYTMPYLQAGRIDEGGSGLYTTQGLAIMSPRPGSAQFMGGNGNDPVDARPVYWAPTVAYRGRLRDGAMSLYLSGAFGQTTYTEPATDGTGGRRRTEPVRALMLGVTAERTIHRPRYRVPFTPPPTPAPRPPGAPPVPPLP